MENHGKHSENILEEICFRIFGSDLVAKSPIVHEPSGDKEFSDILINLGDEIVVFQSKSIDIDAADMDDVRAGRVLKKIQRAKQQFSTTISAQIHGADVSFVNGVGIRSKIDWSKVSIRYGITTINLRDSNYTDPEFRASFPLAIESFRNLEIHTFVLHELFDMAWEVSTPLDFLQYLSDRLYAQKSGSFWVGNELDFIAFMKTRYDVWEDFKEGRSEFSSIGLEPGLWEDFLQIEEINKARSRNFYYSEVVDKTINEMKSTIQFSVDNGLYSETEAILNYEVIVTLLSKLRRIQRRDLGIRMLEKYGRTEERPISYFLSVFEDIDLSVLFMAVNNPNREARKNVMHNFSVAAARRITTSRLLTIGTEGIKADGMSFDFAYYYNVPDLLSEDPVVDPDDVFQPRQDEISQEWDYEES